MCVDWIYSTVPISHNKIHPSKGVYIVQPFGSHYRTLPIDQSSPMESYQSQARPQSFFFPRLKAKKKEIKLNQIERRHNGHRVPFNYNQLIALECNGSSSFATEGPSYHLFDIEKSSCCLKRYCYQIIS